MYVVYVVYVAGLPGGIFVLSHFSEEQRSFSGHLL
jgi:hypothetical protein